MRHAVIGTIGVAAGARKRLRRAESAHRERSLRDAPGALPAEGPGAHEGPHPPRPFEPRADTAASVAHRHGPGTTAVTEEVGQLADPPTGMPSKPGPEVARGR